MNKEQNYYNCKYFKHPKCPTKNKMLMNKLIKEWKRIDGIAIKSFDVINILELREKVNKQFCSPYALYEEK